MQRTPEPLSWLWPCRSPVMPWPQHRRSKAEAVLNADGDQLRPGCSRWYRGLDRRRAFGCDAGWSSRPRPHAGRSTLPTAETGRPSRRRRPARPRPRAQYLRMVGLAVGVALTGVLVRGAGIRPADRPAVGGGQQRSERRSGPRSPVCCRARRRRHQPLATAGARGRRRGGTDRPGRATITASRRG